MAVLIQVRGAEKSYGHQRLLDDASASLTDNVKVGFVGRNGAGKSTLLRVILGEEELEKGEVIRSGEWAGRRTAAASVATCLLYRMPLARNPPGHPTTVRHGGLPWFGMGAARRPQSARRLLWREGLAPSAFLRAPLAFRRISSVFGLRRHPILGVMRAHQGTDYAAAAGTPVRALGDGRVIFAGWKGGYGRVVEIRHRNGFVTRYGHLRGFAAGIRAGTSVGIANTIGFVGATGLATAPHLHFEVLVGGRHRDPRQVLRNLAGEPLAQAYRPAFFSLKSRVFGLLDAPAGSRALGGRDPMNAPRGD